MKFSLPENALWGRLFIGLILGYCLFYAPFGTNETDGGFLTGLAWQVLNGKVLYQDIIYVRPPLPVWLRALEIHWLPDHLAIIGERYIFYAKVGLYTWLGSALLSKEKQQWMLATFGFVVSVHCYPPMAWHTVDGILFAVLAAYLFFKSGDGFFGKMMTVLAGVSLFAALLCKQSFYPLILIFGIGIFAFQWKKGLVFFSGFFLATALFFKYLYQNNLVDGFVKMTSGSTAGGQAFQHGIMDYCSITPELALPSLGLVAAVWWMHRSPRWSKWSLIVWGAWLLALVASFAAITWLRQEHTAPFAQSRALFLVAVALMSSRLWHTNGRQAIAEKPIVVIAPMLLGITWCAAISWGYSLPMLFATPWIWAAMEVSDRLTTQPGRHHNFYRIAILLALLLAFRLGYEFVYRDGTRRTMTENMGAIFPKLSGIYSDPESAARYQDLKRLAEKYGPNFMVLPAFPQANYLTGTTPPLPLDWVVNRETNGDNTLVISCLEQSNPIIFFEKNYIEKLESDAELAVTRVFFEKGTVVEETPFFIVKQR